MKNSSQNQPVGASVPAIPARVSVAMSEIAENLHEGLLALAVGAGLQVMQALMEADVTVLAGPKGKHHMTRSAVRHGRAWVGDPGWPAGADHPPAGRAADRVRGGSDRLV